MTDAEVLQIARETGLTCDEVYQLYRSKTDMNVVKTFVKNDYGDRILVSNVREDGAFVNDGCVFLQVGDAEVCCLIDDLSAAIHAFPRENPPDTFGF